jgi:hypothetical protein
MQAALLHPWTIQRTRSWLQIIARASWELVLRSVLRDVETAREDACIACWIQSSREPGAVNASFHAQQTLRAQDRRLTDVRLAHEFPPFQLFLVGDLSGSYIKLH